MKGHIIHTHHISSPLRPFSLSSASFIVTRVSRNVESWLHRQYANEIQDNHLTTVYKPWNASEWNQRKMANTGVKIIKPQIIKKIFY